MILSREFFHYLNLTIHDVDLEPTIVYDIFFFLLCLL